ncbi:MAG TPA: response regulator [Chloroflexota bacterium]|nr:response regulator [Chloroflexota bacterium]
MSHILVVDDDPAIRDVVVDILEMSNYSVSTATNGAEALEQMRRDAPHAVMLDLMMPVMSGWDFLRACQRDPACQGVPIVVMSAARDAASVADELGAHAFLSKPFELDNMLSVMGQLAPPPGRPADGTPEG